MRRPLKSTPGTDALIELEDALPAVLHDAPGDAAVPLWPLVRQQFAVALQAIDVGLDAAVGGPASTRGPGALRRAARAFLPSCGDVASVRRGSRIMHLVGGSSDVIDEDGRARNWLIGDYANALPNSSMIVQQRELRGKPAFSDTWSVAPAMMRAAVRARLSGARASSERRVRGVVTEIARLLSVQLPAATVERIADEAVYTEGLRPHLMATMNRLLDRVQPRVALLEEASYGHDAVLIAAMRERKILVAEPQHGWIGPSHGAYNFGAAMREPGLIETLPDELLTFGEFWSEGLRYPVPCSPIGKPQIDRMASSARPGAERPKELLVVLSALERPMITRFISEVARLAPDDCLVRVRPHPVEREHFEDSYPGLLGDGVVLDNQSDVYRSLGSARVVVGLASTVLFEAAAMGCVVRVLDSPLVDLYVGDVFGPPISGFEGANRVVQDLTSPSDEVSSMKVPLASIWRPEAVRNFVEWIESRT